MIFFVVFGFCYFFAAVFFKILFFSTYASKELNLIILRQKRKAFRLCVNFVQKAHEGHSVRENLVLVIAELSVHSE